jgi:hypothetical protein
MFFTAITKDLLWAPLKTSCEYSEYPNLLFLCQLALFYPLLYALFPLVVT